MKKITCLLLLVPQINFCQITNPNIPNPQNWSMVFEDNITDLNKWIIQDGDKYYLTEGVNTADQVNVLDGKAILSVEKVPNGFPYGDFNPFINGNGHTARFKSSHIYSKNKYQYGYIEARIKLPSGKGTGSSFWLFPAYREKEIIMTNGNYNYGFPFGYPEEMDIIEQLSALKQNVNTAGEFEDTHLQDAGSLWNNGSTANDITVDKYKYRIDDECNTNIAGQWHTFALKWDLFGQYYYIDDVLFLKNNLWKRKTKTEPMNLVVSHGINTNVKDPDNYELPDNLDLNLDNTKKNIKDESNDPDNFVTITFPDAFVEDNRLLFDWAKVWQEKKFSNKIIWSSGNSNSIGNFDLTDNTNLDDFLVGDFVSNTTYGKDELLSFASNTRSTVQRLVGERGFKSKNVLLYQYDSPTEIEYDLNTVQTISQDLITNAGINGSFNTALSYKNYIRGNFDGKPGDEIFLNNSSHWSSLQKFVGNNSQFTIPPTNAIAPQNEFSEMYAEENRITSSDAPAVPAFPTNTANSSVTVFLAGDLDGKSETIDGQTVFKDELFIINHLDKRYNILTYTSTTPHWKNIMNVAITNTSIGTWVISPNDSYIIDNFDNSTDNKKEVLCYNKNGSAALFQLVAGTWVQLWSTTSSTLWSIAQNNGSFLSGSFLNNGKIQLLAISSNQEYANMYQFVKNATGNTYAFTLVQQNHQNPNTTLEKVKYYTYKYKDSLAEKTCLLSIERYQNPNVNYISDQEQQHKYYTTLTSFSESVNASKNNVANDNKDSISKSDVIAIEKIKIYPNPTNGKFKVSLNKNTEGAYIIYNELGSKILEGKINFTNLIEVDISKAAKGNYFISIISSVETISAKIILE